MNRTNCQRPSFSLGPGRFSEVAGRLFEVDRIDLVVAVRAVPSVQDPDQGRLRDRDVGQVLVVQLHDVPDELPGGQVPKFDLTFAAGSEDVGLGHGHAADLALRNTNHIQLIQK